LADTIDTGSSTHTVSGADLSTDSGAPFLGVGAFNSSLVTRDGLVTSRSTNNRLAAELKGKLSATSGATASVLEAESGLGAGTGGTEGTFETLGVLSSTEGLDAGDSSVTAGTGVVTIVTDGGVDELTVVRSGISSASTTTTTNVGAGSSRGRAEFTELGRRAGTSKETATLSFSEVEFISVVVVGNVPTGRFEESKGELGSLHLVDKTGSHDFEGELSSFEVRSSGTGTTTVFHVSTLKSRASEEASKSGGKRRGVDDYGSSTIKSSRSDVTGESLTTASQPLAVQTLGETESVDNLMHDTDHVLFVEEDIRSGSHVVSRDGSLTNKGSLGTRSQRAGNGTGNVVTGRVNGKEVDVISSNTGSKDGRSRDGADSAGGDLEVTRNGVLDLEGTLEVVHDGTHNLGEVVSVGS